MVSQLTYAIKNQLESRYSSVTVQGEVSNAKLHSSGHLYFDLKDGQAKISAVLFKNSMWPHMKLPKEGDSVVVQASLSVYPPHGKYQLIVKKLELAGIGALLAELEKRKARLKAKGYFDQKRELPAFPKTIGVVTSPTGAVIRDIIHVLSRRLKGFHLILNPARVQGEGAAEEIAAAINEFNEKKLVDVIIVGRGGGSLEDLWPFNEEVVAEALFKSKIPTVSAVGHETDVTLADFVADKRAPTPSAAAEIISGETEKHLADLASLRNQLHKSMTQRLHFARSKLEGYARHPLFASPYNILAMPLQRLDELKTTLQQLMKQRLLQRRMVLTQKARIVTQKSPEKQLALMVQKRRTVKGELDQAMRTTLLLAKQKYTQISQQLAALDPKRVLKRGYSILLAQKDDSVIVSTHQLSKGTAVRALLADGERGLIVDDDI